MNKQKTGMECLHSGIGKKRRFPMMSFCIIRKRFFRNSARTVTKCPVRNRLSDAALHQKLCNAASIP